MIRLHASAEEAAQAVSPSAGVLEPVDEHSCLLRTGAGGLDVMVVHVMLLGIDFEVVEPVELTEHMRTARDRLSRALGDAP